MPTRQEIIEYITQAAQRRGIDPNIALRVFKGESSFNPSAQLITPREESYGLTQLNVKGGLGVEARRRGIEPSDPKQWKQHVDFSLDTVKKGGWRPWSAATKAGIGRWEGVNNTKTVDITDTPSLKTLSAPTISREKKGDPLIPLSQLAPTEATTMARTKHPSYDEAIKQAMAEGTENVQMDPGSFIPRATDIRGRPTAPDIRGSVQLAGAVPTGAVRPKVTKIPKTKENKAVQDAAEREAAGPQPPNREGPYDRTAPGTRGAEGTYEDYVKAEKARMAAEAKRANELRSVPDAGEQIGSPAYPRGVKTESFRPPGTPLGKATTAAGATALGVAGVPGSSGDPAVSAVEDYISGQRRDPAVDARQRQTGGPEDPTSAPATAPRARGANPMSPENPDVTRQILSQALPVMQEVMKDPQAGPAAQVVLKKAAEVTAKRQALQADMRNDPTFYQMQAARQQMQPGGGGGGDPIADRAMERAVMMDQARRASPAPQMQVQAAALPRRGRPQVPVEQGDTGPVKEQARVPSTEEQIVARNIPTPVPTGYPSVPPVSQSYPGPRTPAVMDPTVGANIPQPNAPPPPMDPVQQMLMQFYTQGGSTGGGVMP
jgi:hypothetical protein